MTWEEMVEIEPELGELLEEAKSYTDEPGHRCANDIWYAYKLMPGMNGMKGKVHSLVGTYAKNKLLSSSRCYEIAYRTIYEALPCCGDECQCQGGVKR